MWFKKKKQKNTSHQKYTTYRWILRVIDSCRTQKQLICIDALIHNFHVMYDDYNLVQRLDTYHLTKINKTPYNEI